MKRKEIKEDWEKDGIVIYIYLQICTRSQLSDSHLRISLSIGT